jgi:glutathione S-transferase
MIWVGRKAEDIKQFSLINPTGKVPALRLLDGIIRFESAAILMHLALAHPAAQLTPEPHTREYSQFLQWMVYLAWSHVMTYDLSFALRYAGIPGHADNAISTNFFSVAAPAPSQACADMPCTTAA